MGRQLLLYFILVRHVILGNESEANKIGDEIVDGTVQVRGYGEPCTCDNDCDFNKWLSCASSGYCSCLSRTFVYDFTRESCVVRLGEKCFEVAHDYAQYKDLPPYIRCVEGAFCSISAGGLCACNTYGFYGTLDREKCERKKEFGAKCHKSIECKSEVCLVGSCGCKEIEYYSRTRGRCLGLVGSYCFTDEDCTDNGLCNNVQGATCRCSKGFSPTLKGECIKSLSHGDSCNLTSPCNNIQLGCLNNKCLCLSPDHQTYDQENCQSHISSAPCLGDHTCVPHSKCILVGILSECACLPGYVEMPDGSCGKYLSYGSSCQKNEDCDPLANLFCKDSLCQCKDVLMSLYDPKKRLCRGLVGYRKCQRDDNLCVQNAHCHKTNPALDPRCTCKNSYVTTSSRTCVEDANNLE